MPNPGLRSVFFAAVLFFAALLVTAAPPPQAPAGPRPAFGAWEAVSYRLVVLFGQKQYAQALPAAEAALRLAESRFGPEHPDTATSLANLAEVQAALAKYAEAEPLLERALSIREKALGPAHPDVLESLERLMALYRVQGKFAAAEPLVRRAQAISGKALSQVKPATDLIQSYQQQMMQQWQQQKRPSKSDEQDAQAWVKLQELITKPGNVNVEQIIREADRHPLRNNLYAMMAQASNGFRLAPMAKWLDASATELQAMTKTPDPSVQRLSGEQVAERDAAMESLYRVPDRPDVIAEINAMAELYPPGNEIPPEEARKSGLPRRDHWTAAEFQLAMAERNPTVKPAQLVPHLLAAAMVSWVQGDYATAEAHYRRALKIQEETLGPDHPAVGHILSHLAVLNQVQGKYDVAEPLHQRALRIAEKTFGPDHPRVAAENRYLALLNYARGAPQQARPYFDSSLGGLRRQFEQYFTFLSEKERLAFLDAVSNTFPVFYSFCFTYRDREPALAGAMYDVVLWQKGFVARSVAAVRARIQASGDQEALALLEKLSGLKTELATLLVSRPANQPEMRQRVEELEREANRVEGELVKRAAGFSSEKQQLRITWRQVRNSLRPNEAAVEFVRFPFHNGREWTGSAYYVALIVTADTKDAPVLVSLGEAAKLEGAPLREYRERVKDYATPGALARTGPYEALWKPLEGALGGARRVFVSPDGVLNQVSFGVLPAGPGRLLMEQYDLRLVSSTADLLHQPAPPTGRAAVLFGDPQFGLDEAGQRAAVRRSAERPDPAPAAVDSPRSAELRGNGLSSLPGTRVEVDSIRSILQKEGWTAQSFTGDTALEEAVKRVHQPRVLHLATHGFFLKEQQQGQRGGLAAGSPLSEDPMLRSGLYFAGANRVLAGTAPPAALEDGVLTASEATALDLQGTELVVLSACETGLGQVKSGEGVFGLRRALQVAGAESVLMSLWSVPDRETQELMSLFYARWLAGKSKADALREAQLEMRGRARERHGEDWPFFYGAFVLVGAER